jgi:hypothetical protein
MHITIIAKKYLLKKEKQTKQKKNTTAQMGTSVRAHAFGAELLAASGRSCNQPTRSRVSVVSLGPRANAELVPKFHVPLHASHAALPIVTLKMLPYTNITLTFDFDWITLFMGHMGEGALHREERKKLSNKEIKIWSKMNWPTDLRLKYNL